MKAWIIGPLAASLLLTSLHPPVFAGDLEATFAGAHTAFDDGEMTHGLSMRLRYFLKPRRSGIFIQSSFPASSPLLFDAIAGYALRSEGQYFFEAGGGLRYSPLWGLGLAVLAGVGAEANSRWYVALPIIYRLGFQIEVTPYLGYRF